MMIADALASGIAAQFPENVKMSGHASEYSIHPAGYRRRPLVRYFDSKRSTPW